MSIHQSFKWGLLFIAIVLVPFSVNVSIKHFKSTQLRLHSQSPRIRQERHQQRGSLYLIPGKKEIECDYRRNYVCKFWFFIRCMMLARFDSVYIVNNSEEAYKTLNQSLRPNDMLIFGWRKANHSDFPPQVKILLQERKRAKPDSILHSVRIGIFHIANEEGRTDFPWYTEVDFVLRNYWIQRCPPHVLYVPLAPQYPFRCTPSSILSNTTTSYAKKFLIELSSNKCSCGDISTLPASERKYLWSFSGSLRANRSQLVNTLKKSDVMKNKGTVKISKHFGGDGKFGSLEPERNPKSAHLKLISESAFVFAPCGNVMETHRIYEAVAMGAIPVIENCEPTRAQFFPLRQLIAGNYSETVQFVQKYIGKDKQMDRLQKDMMMWWQTYTQELADNVSLAVRTHVPVEQKWPI